MGMISKIVQRRANLVQIWTIRGKKQSWTTCYYCEDTMYMARSSKAENGIDKETQSKKGNFAAEEEQYKPTDDENIKEIKCWPGRESGEQMNRWIPPQHVLAEWSMWFGEKLQGTYDIGRVSKWANHLGVLCTWCCVICTIHSCMTDNCAPTKVHV